MSPAEETLLIASLLELQVPPAAVPKIVKRIAQEEHEKELLRAELEIANGTIKRIEGIASHKP